jgi:hypothetical protein
MAAAIKGLSFHNVLLFAEHRFGAEGTQQLLDQMSAEDREALASLVHVGWYDLVFYARFLRLLAQVHGSGDFAVVEDYGRFAADHDIGSVYKMLFRITSPGLIFDQAMRLWERFHNTGTWHVERGTRRATGTLSNWGYVDEVLCRELVGYLETMLAHGNCKQVRVQHPKCRAHGAPDCVFTCTWQ